MKGSYGRVKEAAQYVRRHTFLTPRVGILTGTGLGGLADGLEEKKAIETSRIFHFPVSTAPSHAGRLVLGRMAGVPVAVVQGRVHLYEGFAAHEVVFPIRVLKALGVEVLILTNAAGGLNLDFETGDVMVIRDHINLTGENPLTGWNEERWGARFPDMAGAYDPALQALALSAGEGFGRGLRTGVYAGLRGPSLETPAENRFLKTIGADAVGFSTVLEVIAAVHGGMRVLGLSTITNINDPDRPSPALLGDILQAAQAASPRVAAVILAVIKGL